MQQAWPTPGPCPVLVQLVITALKCHKYDKNIQVTGSAALFYLTNSEYRSEQSVRLRRQVIQVVLNGMESYQEVTVSPCPLPALAPRPVSRPCQQARRSLGCHACPPPGPQAFAPACSSALLPSNALLGGCCFFFFSNSCFCFKSNQVFTGEKLQLWV